MKKVILLLLVIFVVLFYKAFNNDTNNTTEVYTESKYIEEDIQLEKKFQLIFLCLKPNQKKFLKKI